LIWMDLVTVYPIDISRKERFREKCIIDNLGVAKCVRAFSQTKCFAIHGKCLFSCRKAI
jgi:hypothetical protein